MNKILCGSSKITCHPIRSVSNKEDFTFVMDFDSPDVEKDFPGLYASENNRKHQSRDSDYSDDEKTSRKDLLGKKREKRESKKDKGYAALEGESSNEDEETRSPGKNKKSKSTFKLGKDKKEKHNKKDKDRESKEKKEEKEKEKVCKKESKELKKESKDAEKLKDKKKKKENKLLKIKDKKKKSIDQDATGEEEKPIFGVPLQIAVERSKSHDGIDIPVIVRECIDYIEEHGLGCESIYKISGVKSKVRHLKSQYNKREKIYLYEHEPHIVASLLKQFLRDLPEPVLTAELSPKFEEVAAFKNEKKRVEALQKLLSELPHCNRLLLSWIFVHMLHVVNYEKRNKMNIQNISIALSPALHISHHALQILFAHSDILFKGIEIKKYVPPIELDSSRLSLELPDSPTAIEEELGKHENVLNNLHAELNSGVRDEEKEEKLWEIQRVVTQLKRKLRFLRQVQDASNVTEVQTDKSSTDAKVSSSVNQKPTGDVAAINKPLQEKTFKKDSKVISSIPAQLKTVLKSPDVTTKSPDVPPVSLNVTAISPNVIVTLPNTTAILSNVTSMSSNATSILSNATSMSSNATAMSSNATAVLSNATAILPNATTVSVNVSGKSSNVIIKLPDVTAKSPPKCDNNIENKFIISSHAKKSVDCKIGNVSKSVPMPVPDIPAVEKEDSCRTLVENSAHNVKNKVDIDISQKEVTEPIIKSIPNPEVKVPYLTEDEATMHLLLQEERMLQLQTEELMLLGDELRRKVFSENMEIDRLKGEIHEYQQIYKYTRYSFDSTENSSSESEDSSDTDEEEHMSSMLEELMRENKLLEAKNAELTKVIQQERDRCLNAKVQIKMLQQYDFKSEMNYRTRM